MRLVSPDFNTSLHQVSTKFARLWTITSQGGKVINITDHDSNILVAGQLFVASIGFTSTAVMTSSISIGSQNVELMVPLTGSGMTESDIRNRLWIEAAASLMVVDYEHPENGLMRIFTGIVGRCVLSNKNRATVEVISFTDPNLNVANEQYSSSCRASLGDAICRFPIFSFATNFTVTGRIDTMAFTVDTMSGQLDDFYALGQIKWLTGANANLISDVATNVAAMLSVGLFYPLPFPVAVSDTGEMLPGCDKQLTTCFKKFDNILNFRGEALSPSFGI
jgi:uncharacterized phage protein (TIGR02218 family)